MRYTATIIDPHEPDVMPLWESSDHASTDDAYWAAQAYVHATQPGDRIVAAEGRGVYAIWSDDMASRAHVATLVIAPADQ